MPWSDSQQTDGRTDGWHAVVDYSIRIDDDKTCESMCHEPELPANAL